MHIDWLVLSLFVSVLLVRGQLPGQLLLCLLNCFCCQFLFIDYLFDQYLKMID